MKRGLRKVGFWVKVVEEVGGIVSFRRSLESCFVLKMSTFELVFGFIRVDRVDVVGVVFWGEDLDVLGEG